MNLEDATIQGLNNLTLWTGIRTRLFSLLKLLDSVGCFILTKGTIENYYRYIEDIPVDEKPNAAAYEASNFLNVDENDLKNVYADVVKAVAFASQAQKINEGAAIREAVLATISPILATLTTDTTTQQLFMQNKSLLGNRADLFKMEVDILFWAEYKSLKYALYIPKLLKI